jgi:protein-disulfide isomerase-like protein with CxxC motif
MAGDIERTLDSLNGRVDFDLLLGGINTASTLPVGEYGRKRFQSLWREVTEVTGQAFRGQLPHESFVYNSTLPCRAVHAVRVLSREPPFAFLHLLQQQFFLHGADICDLTVLIEAAAYLGVDEFSFRRAMLDSTLHEQVSNEFESARVYGTQALPAVLVEDQTGRRLLAGGYVSADVLIEQLANLL